MGHYHIIPQKSPETEAFLRNRINSLRQYFQAFNWSLSEFSKYFSEGNTMSNPQHGANETPAPFHATRSSSSRTKAIRSRRQQASRAAEVSHSPRLSEGLAANRRTCLGDRKSRLGLYSRISFNHRALVRRHLDNAG
jgi:hypothetical protein